MEPQDLSPVPLDAGTGAAAVAAIDLHGPSLVLPGVEGSHPLGPATIDSDTDGLPDTALVPSAGTGSGHDLLALATDLDHDGDVDVVTALSPDGTARSETVAAPPPPDATWDAGWAGPPPAAAILDPATGTWIRSG